jgi:hypothetical protein
MVPTEGVSGLLREMGWTPHSQLIVVQMLLKCDALINDMEWSHVGVPHSMGYAVPFIISFKWLGKVVPSYASTVYMVALSA